MKRFALLVALDVLLPLTCAAQNVSISWDASSTPGVTYNLYRTETAEGCGLQGEVGITDETCLKVNTAPIILLTFSDTPGSGRWFYVARAVDEDGIESVNSNVLEVWLGTKPTIRRGRPIPPEEADSGWWIVTSDPEGPAKKP